MTTTSTSDAARRWYLVDAEGKILGRLATRVARVLSGRNKPDYVPHLDRGDFVVVINAGRIRVTGHKLSEKIYYHHSNYPGGLSRRTLAEMLERRPTRVIELAVKRMLPKNRLAARMFRRLLVYPDARHPHHAQRPQEMTL